MLSTMSRAPRRTVVGVLVAGLAVGATLVATPAPAQADDVTVSYDTLRTGWDPNEPTLVAVRRLGRRLRPALRHPARRPDLREAGRRPGDGDGRDREQQRLRPRPGDRARSRWTRNVGRPWPASAIGCGDLVPNIGITGTPVVRPRDGDRLLHGQGQRRARPRPPALVHARARHHDRRRAVRVAGDDPGQPEQRPDQHLHPQDRHAAPGPAAARRGRLCRLRQQLRHRPVRRVRRRSRRGDGRQTTLWSTEVGSVQRPARHLAVRRRPGLRRPGPDHPGHRQRGVARPRPGHQPTRHARRVGGPAPGQLRRQPAAKDFFSPVNNSKLDQDDTDLGSGGPLAIPAGFGTPAHPHLIVQIGKDGQVYLLDRDNLGGIGAGPGRHRRVAVQPLGPYNGVWGHPAFWGGDGGYVYLVQNQGPLAAFKIGVIGERAADADLASQPVRAVRLHVGFAGGHLQRHDVRFGVGVGGLRQRLERRRRSAPRVLRAALERADARCATAAPIGTATKFSVPATDKGRVYVGNRTAVVYGFGRPTTVGSARVADRLRLRRRRHHSDGDGHRDGAADRHRHERLDECPVHGERQRAAESAGHRPDADRAGHFHTDGSDVAVRRADVRHQRGAVAFDLHGIGTKDGLAAAPSSLAFGTVPTGGAQDLEREHHQHRDHDRARSPASRRRPRRSPRRASRQRVDPRRRRVGLGAGHASPRPPPAPRRAARLSSSTGNVARYPLTGTGVAGAPKLTITPNRPRLRLDPGRHDRDQDVRHHQHREHARSPSTRRLRRRRPSSRPPGLGGPAALAGRHDPPGGHLRPDGAGRYSGTYQITGNDGTGARNVTVHGVGDKRRPGEVLGPAAKCLDIRGPGSADGTPVQIYECNGTGAQQWTYGTDGTLTGAGQVPGRLRQRHRRTAPRAAVDLQRHRRAAWTSRRNGSLRNPQSGRCLDLPGGNRHRRVDPLQIYDCNGPRRRAGDRLGRSPRSAAGPDPRPRQQVPRRPGRLRSPTAPRSSCTRATATSRSGGRCRGTSTLQAVGECLDVADGGTANGSRVQLWTCNGTGAQVWVHPSSAAPCSTPKSGRCLDVPGASSTDSTALQLYDCNGTAAQKWTPPV